VINPNPPATFSNVTECSAAAELVAYPRWKSEAAMKAKRKTRPKNAQAKGRFVRREPTRKIALTIHLYGTVRMKSFKSLVKSIL
jgi:hypothetical protein